MSVGLRLGEKEKEIAEGLKKKALDCELRYFATVSSTMDAANDALKSAAPGKPLVIISDMQSGGRGRQARQWQSLPGNLFMTIAFPAGDLKKFAGFSLAVGLALNRALGGLGCRTRLKWPNDLLSLSGKKLGGILIETGDSGGRQYLLVGVGINVAASPEGMENATYMNLVAGQDIPLGRILLAIIPAIAESFTKFEEKGFAPLRSDWMLNAAYVGRDISVNVSTDRKLKGMMVGVTADGLLQLEVNGKIEVLPAGDLELAE